MKRLLFLSLLFFTACHKAGGGDTSPKPLNITGTWDGLIQADGASTRFYFILTDENGDGAVSGIFNLSDGVSQGHFTGTVDAGGNFDFTLDEGTSCHPKPTGTALIANNQMTLHFSGHTNCGMNVSDAHGTIGH